MDEKAKYIKAIGARIKQMRKDMGMNQREFASNVGLDERHLRRIEKGKANPTIATLYDILDFTKSDFSQFFES